MRARACALWLVGLTCWLPVVLATNGAQAAGRNAAVVIDSGWSADFAVSSCAQANSFMSEETKSRIRTFGCGAIPGCPEVMSRLTACASALDPKAQARQFEDRLMAEFAADPACKGAAFVRDYGWHVQPPSATEQAVMSRPHWQLSIDFVAGAPTQSWSLQYLGEDDVTHGEGATETGIAGDVCAVVGRQGAAPPP